MAVNNRETAKVSFCLPVYNVKKYLEACMQSITSQKVDHFEIICVDDCSTDGSLEELHRLAALFPEITIIPNNRNRGVSYSRNKALQHASGDYIWFVDPDDMLAPDVVNRYLEIAYKTGAEAVLGNLNYFVDGTSPQLEYTGSGEYRKIDFSSTKNFYVGCDQSGKIAFGVWLGLFSRQFLMGNEISFEEQLSTLEDYCFYYKVGIHSSNIIHVDYIGYLYRVRVGSLSYRSATAKYEKRFKCAKTVVNLYKADLYLPEYEKYRKVIEGHITQMAGFATIYLAAITDSQYVRQELRKMKEEGLYPYHYSEEASFVTHRKLTSFVIKHLLPHEFFFWTFHYGYKFKYRIAVYKQKRIQK